METTVKSLVCPIVLIVITHAHYVKANTSVKMEFVLSALMAVKLAQVKTMNVFLVKLAILTLREPVPNTVWKTVNLVMTLVLYAKLAFS